jgi:hypothetical protein
MGHSTLASLPLLLLVTACGGPSHEAMAEKGIQQLEQIATLFEGIKDEASAKAAAPQLDKLFDQMAAMKAESEKMPKPSAEVEKALEEKFSARGQAAMTKMMQAMMKVGTDEKIGAVMKPLMAKFEKMK